MIWPPWRSMMPRQSSTPFSGSAVAADPSRNIASYWVRAASSFFCFFFAITLPLVLSGTAGSTSLFLFFLVFSCVKRVHCCHDTFFDPRHQGRGGFFNRGLDGLSLLGRKRLKHIILAGHNRR